MVDKDKVIELIERGQETDFVILRENFTIQPRKQI